MMADKMATVQHYNWLYLSILHFAVWQHLRWPFLYSVHYNIGVSTDFRPQMRPVTGRSSAGTNQVISLYPRDDDNYDSVDPPVTRESLIYEN